ncbi:MAG TPA: hypothetical protein VFP37_19040 [Steroidobacteraceae bacterium]|nr:hypothetical protein [Steroidobacteraceae bacterium]
MIFSLDVRRARKGDCLLLHYGTAANPRVILIDGGPKDVYKPFLKPRLEDLRDRRAPGQPLLVDMVMVSHVDDDHIQGILDLARELRDAPGTPLVQVARLWHNSFDNILGKSPKELTAAVTAQFGAAALSGDLPADASIDMGASADDEEEEIARASLMVLASIAQGSKLRGDAKALGWAVNPEANGKLILAAKDPVDIGHGLRFTVAGPQQPELKKLQQAHDKWVAAQKKKKKKDPQAALAAYVDQSVPNLSSIVVLAECDGKRMLLTGDARGDKILAGLEKSGALKKGGKMHVELLKVPHHGSSNNLEEDFFRRITADHYVFSGDGEHGNPERETLEMLRKARKNSPFTIHLTYPVAEIDAGRKADWQTQQAKERAKKKKNGKIKVREDWAPAKHAIAPVLAQLAAGQNIVVGDGAAAHVIDLGDPLGY